MTGARESPCWWRPASTGLHSHGQNDRCHHATPPTHHSPTADAHAEFQHTRQATMFK